MKIRADLKRFRHVGYTALTAMLVLQSAADSKAAERLVLLELFTNDACPFCSSLTPSLERLLADYGGRVAPVFYHVNWPNPSDPFYDLAGISVEGRLRFYGVEAIPHLFIDGIPVPDRLRFESDNMDSLRSLIEQRLAMSSPLAITFSSETRPGVSGLDTTTVAVSLTVDGSLPSTDLAWQVAAVEFFVERSSAPGQFSAIRYGHVFRRSAPEAELQPLGFSSGQASAEVSFVRDPKWDDDRIGLVVFVQDTVTGEVLQSATDLPRFDFEMPRQIEHAAASSSISFEIVLVNRHVASATYEIFTAVPDTVPVVTNLSASGATFQNDTLVVQANPGEAKNVTLAADLTGRPAEGLFHVHAREVSHRAIEWVRPTKVLSGFRTLYVDDNGAAAIDTFYTSAFEAAGVSIDGGSELRVGTWETTLGQLTEEDLSGVELLFWATGSRFPGLTSADRQVITSFLDRGGSFFVSGQDIGWELADTTSPFFSEESEQFYNRVLHAEFLEDDANDMDLRGVPGDPIGNNLVLRLSGGDGANNQSSPDLIAPVEPALAVFEYDTSRVGAVRVDTGTYRLVYFSFGFEAINTRSTRNQVMRRIIEWLRSPATTVAARPAVPAIRFEVLPNRPNPFNPNTRIFFRLSRSGHVRVTVFDLLGRRLATLADGPFSAGDHSVIFDAGGLPSGVYLYEVAYGKELRRGKMMLVR